MFQKIFVKQNFSQPCLKYTNIWLIGTLKWIQKKANGFKCLRLNFSDITKIILKYNPVNQFQ